MAKQRKRSEPREISKQEAVHRPALEFATSNTYRPNPELDREITQLHAESKELPADKRAAFNAKIAEIASEKSTQATIAKVGADMETITWLPEDANRQLRSAYTIFVKPKSGRPFEKEKDDGQITLTLRVADNGNVEIVGDGDPVPTRSRHFVHMFIEIYRGLEAGTDYGDPDKRDCNFVWPLKGKVNKMTDRNNADRIAGRLRELLLRCVPPRHRQTVIKAIHSDGTNLVINPTLRFRLPRPRDIEYKQKPLEGDVAAKVPEVISEIWTSPEERETVVSWLNRRMPALGAEEYKRNLPFLRKLLDMPE